MTDYSIEVPLGTDSGTPGIPATRTLRQRYETMQLDREPYLRRARAAAALTLPTMIPPEGYTGQTDLPTPYQSVGAHGANNLAAKLLLALFPPNAPFFKFVVDPFALAKAMGVAGEQAAKAQKEVEASLLKAEEAIQGDMEVTGLRPYLHEAIKHLIVAGNAVFYAGYVQSDERPQVFHLQNFCIERVGDRIGVILIRERVKQSALPIDWPRDASDTVGYDTVDVFTCCERSVKGDWHVWQESGSKPLPNKDWHYTDDTMPYIVLRAEVVSGDAYGRGYVEQYQGDLQSLEGLAQAIVEAAAALAMGRVLVAPNGVTDKDELADAPNWGFVSGRKEDVGGMELGKMGDLQVTAKTADTVEGRISLAFLLNSSVRRNAERVTAEEIRAMIQELEQGLGGVYSLLSREFQLPLVTLLMSRLQSEGRFPKFKNSKIVRPSIVTGIEALGRGNDLSRIAQAAGVLVQAYANPQVSSLYRGSAFALRVYTASGVRADDFLKTDEEIAQEAQAAQQNALSQRVGPNVVNALANSAQAQGQAQPPQPNP